VCNPSPCYTRGRNGRFETGVSPRHPGCSHPQDTGLGTVARLWSRQLIRRQSDDALLLEEGTLYPALWRLESKKLVAAEWGLSENNRKAKFYRLTPEGRRHLREGTKTWEAYAVAVTKVLSAAQPPREETA
jgi:hypothetical protein